MQADHPSRRFHEHTDPSRRFHEHTDPSRRFHEHTDWFDTMEAEWARDEERRKQYDAKNAELDAKIAYNLKYVEKMKKEWREREHSRSWTLAQARYLCDLYGGVSRHFEGLYLFRAAFR